MTQYVESFGDLGRAWWAALFGYGVVFPIYWFCLELHNNGFTWITAAALLRKKGLKYAFVYAIVSFICGVAALYVSPFGGLRTLCAVSAKNGSIWTFWGAITDYKKMCLYFCFGAFSFVLSELLSLHNPIEDLLALSVGVGVTAVNVFVRERCLLSAPFPFISCVMLSVLGALPVLLLSPLNPVKTLFAVCTGLYTNIFLLDEKLLEPAKDRGATFLLVCAMIGFVLTAALSPYNPTWSLWSPDMTSFNAVEELLAQDVSWIDIKKQSKQAIMLTCMILFATIVVRFGQQKVLCLVVGSGFALAKLLSLISE